MVGMSLWQWLGIANPKDADGENRLHEIEKALASLGPERARYLACFAYILTRPARADHAVTDAEAVRMREIIVERTGVTEAQAEAIVRVAREAARHSGGTEDYLITREFERLASREEKLRAARCALRNQRRGRIDPDGGGQRSPSRRERTEAGARGLHRHPEKTPRAPRSVSPQLARLTAKEISEALERDHAKRLEASSRMRQREALATLAHPNAPDLLTSCDPSWSPDLLQSPALILRA